MPDTIPALDRVSLVLIVSVSSETDATFALSLPLFFYTVEGTESIDPLLAYLVGPETQAMIVDTVFYPVEQSAAPDVDEAF